MRDTHTDIYHRVSHSSMLRIGFDLTGIWMPAIGKLPIKRVHSENYNTECRARRFKDFLFNLTFSMHRALVGIVTSVKLISSLTNIAISVSVAWVECDSRNMCGVVEWLLTCSCFIVYLCLKRDGYWHVVLLCTYACYVKVRITTSYHTIEKMHMLCNNGKYMLGNVPLRQLWHKHSRKYAISDGIS